MREAERRGRVEFHFRPLTHSTAGSAQLGSLASLHLLGQDENCRRQASTSGDNMGGRPKRPQFKRRRRWRARAQHHPSPSSSEMPRFQPQPPPPPPPPPPPLPLQPTRVSNQTKGLQRQWIWLAALLSLCLWAPGGVCSLDRREVASAIGRPGQRTQVANGFERLKVSLSSFRKVEHRDQVAASAPMINGSKREPRGTIGRPAKRLAAAEAPEARTEARASQLQQLNKQQQIQEQAFQRRLMELKQKYKTNRAISDRAYYVLLAIYSALILIGSLSNGLICLTVLLKPKILSPRNIFIVNLAGSDLLLCVFTMPFSFIEISMKMWQMGLIPCKLVAGLQATSIFVSTISITAIALDRYRVIVYPTHQEAASGTRGAALLLASVWIGALLLSLPLFRFRTVEHLDLPHKYDTIKSIDFCVEAWPFAHGRGIYSVISMMFQYVLPITIVCVVYAKISDKLQKRLIRRQRLTQLEWQQKRQLNLIKRTHTMLISVSLIFGLSWLPLNLLNVIGDFSDLFKGDDQLFRIVFAVCHLIGCSSACSNPMLYGYLNENFRKELRQVYAHRLHGLVRLLRRLCGSMRHTSYLASTPTSTIGSSSSANSSAPSESSSERSGCEHDEELATSLSLSSGRNNYEEEEDKAICQRDRQSGGMDAGSPLARRSNLHQLLPMGAAGTQHAHAHAAAATETGQKCPANATRDDRMGAGCRYLGAAQQDACAADRRLSFQTTASSGQTLGRTIKFCLCVSGSSSTETLGGSARIKPPTFEQRASRRPNGRRQAKAQGRRRASSVELRALQVLAGGHRKRKRRGRRKWGPDCRCKCHGPATKTVELIGRPSELTAALGETANKGGQLVVEREAGLPPKCCRMVPISARSINQLVKASPPSNGRRVWLRFFSLKKCNVGGGQPTGNGPGKEAHLSSADKRAQTGADLEQRLAGAEGELGEGGHCSECVRGQRWRGSACSGAAHGAELRAGSGQSKAMIGQMERLTLVPETSGAAFREQAARTYYLSAETARSWERKRSSDLSTNREHSTSLVWLNSTDLEPGRQCVNEVAAPVGKWRVGQRGKRSASDDLAKFSEMPMGADCKRSSADCMQVPLNCGPLHANPSQGQLSGRLSPLDGPKGLPSNEMAASGGCAADSGQGWPKGGDKNHCIARGSQLCAPQPEHNQSSRLGSVKIELHSANKCHPPSAPTKQTDQTNQGHQCTYSNSSSYACLNSQWSSCSCSTSSCQLLGAPNEQSQAPDQVRLRASSTSAAARVSAPTRAPAPTPAPTPAPNPPIVGTFAQARSCSTSNSAASAVNSTSRSSLSESLCSSISSLLSSVSSCEQAECSRSPGATRTTMGGDTERARKLSVSSFGSSATTNQTNLATIDELPQIRANRSDTSNANNHPAAYVGLKQNSARLVNNMLAGDANSSQVRAAKVELGPSMGHPICGPLNREPA